MPSFRAVLRFIRRSAKRVGVTIAGFALILLGAVMLITPGPGWAAIFAGLALLATEYVWARKALEATKRRVRDAAQRVRRRKPEPEPGPGSPEHPSA